MKHIRAKTAAAYSLLVILMIAGGFMLYRQELNRLVKKEQTMCRMKVDAVADMVSFLEETRNESLTSFGRHVQNSLRFMTSWLAGYASADGYTGPRLFEDGAVVELRGGRAVWPEGVPEGFPALSADEVRQGKQIRAAVPGAEESAEFIFTPGRITDTLYYLNWADANEMLQDQYAYLRDDEFLAMAEKSLEGTLILVSTEDSSLPLCYESAGYPGVRTAAELGFTPQILAQRQAVLQTGRLSGLCTCAELENGAKTLIHINPLEPLIRRALLFVSIFLLTMLIILAVLVTYILSILRFIRNRRVTSRQAFRYQPKNVRRIAATAGVTGALVLFIITSVCHTMDAIHAESITDAQEFSSLSEYLQNTAGERSRYESGHEAEWVVYHGQQIASRISADPAAGSREKLKEYCGLFGIDYIMLFDTEGKEIACSEDYAGFTMNAGLGEDSADFKRLLLGVPSIIHGPSFDRVTGLTRQFIGVGIPSGSETENRLHGALVLAVQPWQSPMKDAEIGRHFLRFRSNGRLFLNADPENGTILFASDPELPGRTVTEYGLPKESLQGGFSDFTAAGGTDSFATSVRQTAMVFYYIVSGAELFSGTLPSCVQGLTFYFAALAVLLWICLRGYNQQTFEEYVGSVEWTHMDLQRTIGSSGAEKAEKKVSFAGLLVGKSRNSTSWDERTPESQAGIVLKADLLVMCLIPLLIFLEGGGNSSLIRFILYGSWMRGFNLFAFCGIAIVSSLGSLLLIVSNVILSLIARFTGRASETICRLLYSLLHYVIILSILFYVFEFVNLPLSTYFASLSVVSLALSIGSKDMVADILAGLLIVFENQFQVGDIVEIDGYRGRVLEIGIRSTQVLGSSNDVRYISNSSIRTIVNKSKRRSKCRISLDFRTRESLEAVEALFARELPKIAEKTDSVTDRLALDGLTVLSGGGEPGSPRILSAEIKCECREGDLNQVRHIVSRELYLMCEREKIELTSFPGSFAGGLVFSDLSSARPRQ